MLPFGPRRSPGNGFRNSFRGCHASRERCRLLRTPGDADFSNRTTWLMGMEAGALTRQRRLRPPGTCQPAARIARRRANGPGWQRGGVRRDRYIPTHRRMCTQRIARFSSDFDVMTNKLRPRMIKSIHPDLADSTAARSNAQRLLVDLGRIAGEEWEDEHE